MSRQKMVDSRSERRHRTLVLRFERFKILLRSRHYLKHSIEHIASQFGLTVNFRVTPKRPDAIVLKLPEEIFGLHIARTENGREMIVADYMSQPPFIAMHGDSRREVSAINCWPVFG